MRKAFKHVGVLMMTAVVGLSVIGAAYALWFEDLKFQAQVATGTFDVDWSYHDVEPVVGVVPAGETEVPPRGWLVGDAIPDGKAPVCNAGEIDNLTGNSPYGTGPLANDVADQNWLRLTGEGLYPFAGCQWSINIHNQGTVPAHFQVIYVLRECETLPETYGPTGQTFPLPEGAPSPNVVPEACTTTGFPLVFSVAGAHWDGNAAGQPDRTALAACNALFSEDVQPGATIAGIQLHQSYELHCDIRVTLEQSALAEADWFQWVILFRAHQWNEDQEAPDS